MKNIFKSFLAVAAFASVISISSCTKTCDAGFEGSNCKTEIRAKFLKNNATVADNCAGSGYNMSITSKASDVKLVVFSNLGNFSTPAVVEASADATGLTATQYVDATGRKFTLTGTVNGSVLTINYTVVYTDNTSETCTATVSL